LAVLIVVAAAFIAFTLERLPARARQLDRRR